MSRDAVSGAALVLGAAAGLVTMALHPSDLGHGTPEQMATMLRINALAHGLALLSVALTFFGALGITRRLDDEPGLALGALVAWGFAAVAILCAAVTSGFIAPALFEHLADATDAEKAALEVVSDYSWFFNQAFAKVDVVASSAAIALWSLLILRDGALPRWLGWYGAVLGAVAILAQFSGHMRLSVHGFGLLVLGQSVWLVGAGLGLRSKRAVAA